MGLNPETISPPKCDGCGQLKKLKPKSGFFSEGDRLICTNSECPLKQQQGGIFRA